MKDWVRQGSLYLTALFALAAFTVISPFYSKVATAHGIPEV